MKHLKKTKGLWFAARNGESMRFSRVLDALLWLAGVTQ